MSYIRNPVILTILSAGLLILSFTPYEQSWLAWISLVPLFFLIKPGRPLLNLCHGFLVGLLFYLGIFYWLYEIGGTGWLEKLAFQSYLALYVAVFGLLAGYLRGASLLYGAPSIWCLLEYVRAHAGFMAFTAGSLGYSQYQNITVIQIASLVGFYGVSFIIVFVNAALYLAMTSPRWRLHSIVTSVVLILSTLIYGAINTQEYQPDKSLSVGLVQANIAQEAKWEESRLQEHLDKHISLSRQLKDSYNPVLVVWPETSVQTPFVHTIAAREQLFNLASELGAHMIVGSNEIARFTGAMKYKDLSWENNAYLISPEGMISGKYVKRHLMPFYEYLPAKEYIPWPEKYEHNAKKYISGSEATVFTIDDVQVGTVICWESLFPEMVRSLVQNNAQLIVNIGNEAWFLDTPGIPQMFAMNVLRAVENRVTMVRALNTGVSAFIDPYGRVLGKLSKNGKEVEVDAVGAMDVPIVQSGTVYTQYGDYPLLVIMSLILVVISINGIRKKMTV